MHYVPALDSLRALAVMLVVAFHTNRFAPGGYVGVDLFFVLSSFLIVRLLRAEMERSQKIDVIGFYLRRVRRLLPALLLMLLTYILVAPLIWPGHPHVTDALWAASYLSDYTVAWSQTPFYLQHTWSLAVEEQFYLFVPLLAPALIRSRRPILMCLIAYGLVWIWRLSLDFPESYYRGDAHCGGLILGAALAFAVDRLEFSKGAGWCGAIILVTAAFYSDFSSTSLTGPAAEIGAALLIGATWKHRAPTPFSNLGRLSYAIYLCHYPIAVAVRDHLPSWAAFVVVTAASIALASLSRPIELHFQRRVGRAPDRNSATAT